MKPLIDGHGRPIGDVRISVTDRCNFRCQYCMPAEGLPWLEPRVAALLRGDRAAGGAARRHGRPRRAPDRRRAARAQGAVAAGRDAVGARGRPRPLADHQRLPARAPGRRSRARRAQAHQRLARLARARPLLPAHAARLARRGARGARGRRGPRSCGPIKVNVVALKDFTEDEVVRFADFARRTPYVVRFIEFMPLDADRSWSADKVLPNEEIRRLINEVHSARAGRPRAPRHLAALALRRRPGRDRLHLPRRASRSAATATASA